jgi:hypothetical protein
VSTRSDGAVTKETKMSTEEREERRAARRILARLYARGDYDLAGMIEQYLENRAGGANVPGLPAMFLE